MLGDNIRKRESGAHPSPGEEHNEEAWRDATQAVNSCRLEGSKVELTNEACWCGEWDARRPFPRVDFEPTKAYATG